MTADYEVGRARPPKSGQFRRGKSGNPSGRPKGTAKTSSVAAELAEEMQETIIVRENGVERKITKLRAVLKSLVTAAIKGDIRAINAIVACTRNFGIGSAAESSVDPEPTSLDQFELLEAFIERERQRRERQKSKSDETKPSQGKP
jgi:hypothetical protein